MTQLDENVMRVLQMLQDGKISTTEAEALIAALRGEKSSAPKSAPTPEPEPEPAQRSPMGDFASRIKTQKIEFDFEHLGDRISKAVAKVHPEKIVARVQAQLRTATKSSASWGATVSARVRQWADGDDARPSNTAGLPEHSEINAQDFHLEINANVLVENPFGNVTIIGTDDDKAHVNYTKVVWGAAESLRALAGTLSVDYFANDTRLDVKVNAPDHFKDGVLDLELRVPRSVSNRTSTRFGDVAITGILGRVEAVSTSGTLKLSELGSDLRCESVSGDIDLQKILGSVTVASESGEIGVTEVLRGLTANSVSGDVTASNVEGGKVECKSVSGDVKVHSVGANAPLDIIVESVSGDASLTNATGNVAIKAVSGDVHAQDLVASRVQAHTVSGDVNVRIATSFSGTVQINTVSGDVELALPSDTNARVSLSTSSGDLRCDHDATGVVATETLWTGTVGTGAGNVTIQTISGGSHVAQIG